MDLVSNAGAGLVVGWLLLGPAILIAFSKVLAGRRKFLWLACAITPLILSAMAGVLMVRFGQSEFNIHADFPPLFFGALFGVWIVYGAYKRQCVNKMAPSSTLHADARGSAALDQPPSARAGERGR